MVQIRKELLTVGRSDEVGEVIEVALAYDQESHIMWLHKDDLIKMGITDEYHGWSSYESYVVLTRKQVLTRRALTVETRLVDEDNGKPISPWRKVLALVGPGDGCCRTTGREIRNNYKIGTPPRTSTLVLGSTKQVFDNYILSLR